MSRSRRRDKIEAVSIEREEDWEGAFRQLADAIAAGRSATPETLPGEEGDPFPYDRDQYMAAVRSRFGVANLQGLYLTGAGYARDDVLLEDVYVEPDLEVAGPVARGETPGDRAEAELGSLRTAIAAREREAEGEPRPEGRREPAGRVLQRESRLLIVGAPGQGKSTLLRRTLLEAAAAWRDQPLNHPLPVYLRLGDWEARKEPAEGRLLGNLTDMLPRLGEISSRAVAAWSGRPVLWLLDGIDEIRDPRERDRFREEVLAVAGRRPGDRWLVATRPAGAPAGGFAPGWARAELPKLSERQMQAVLERWSRVLRDKEGLTLDARATAKALRLDPGLRELRGNALLLTLAILFSRPASGCRRTAGSSTAWPRRRSATRGSATVSIAPRSISPATTSRSSSRGWP